MVFDKQLMLPGDSLFKIFEEIGTADFLLAILSPHSVNSSWVQKNSKVQWLEKSKKRTSRSSYYQGGLPATDESKSSFAGKIQGPVLRQAILHGL